MNNYIKLPAVLLLADGTVYHGKAAGKIGTTKPNETFAAINDGRKPHLLMDIHDESEVNDPAIHLSEINGPAHSDTFTPGTSLK